MDVTNRLNEEAAFLVCHAAHIVPHVRKECRRHIEALLCLVEGSDFLANTQSDGGVNMESM